MPTLITSACLPAILLFLGPTQLEWRVTFKCGRIELCVQFDVAGADFNCPRTCSLAPLIDKICAHSWPNRYLYYFMHH